MKLSQIAEKIGAVLEGADAEVTGIAGIDSAGEGDITFVSNPKYFSKLKSTKAAAVIVPEGIACEKPRLVSKNPYLAFEKALSILKKTFRPPPPGVSPSAMVLSDGIPSSVSVGAFSFVSKGVKLGENVVIMPNVFIGENVEIGDASVIFPQVVIREDVKIGKNTVIHSGSVIGSDGFGYVDEGFRRVKIPQTGTVVIGDNVEIGAGVTIDRATLEVTEIGDGTKIDNLVQIAHNVKIGKNCVIVAQVGIAGSTEIGDNCVVAGQAGVSGHLKIGKNVTIGARAGVIGNVDDGKIISGFPARDHRQMMKIYAALAKLPEL
ncbi:MAG: UDP-3-O-(3-hydroxymyristoyl)glucosamine N-acyltransferase, partial [Elusimicrobia bacterium]|nr:UDP-3-O-(3-hydroxymyristoyl)glucosamine N-acyltransferase [Elusimicrobiota bacterium]